MTSAFFCSHFKKLCNMIIYIQNESERTKYLRYLRSDIRFHTPKTGDIVLVS